MIATILVKLQAFRSASTLARCFVILIQYISQRMFPLVIEMKGKGVYATCISFVQFPQRNKRCYQQTTHSCFISPFNNVVRNIISTQVCALVNLRHMYWSNPGLVYSHFLILESVHNLQSTNIGNVRNSNLCIIGNIAFINNC